MKKRYNSSNIIVQKDGYTIQELLKLGKETDMIVLARKKPIKNHKSKYHHDELKFINLIFSFFRTLGLLLLFNTNSVSEDINNENK